VTPQTTFLLIRHGLTDAVGRFLSGRAPGVHLNAEGQRQANVLASRLHGSGLAAVLSSPLERTLETARPIARDHGLEVEVDQRLTELDVGDWTGRRFDELADDPRWRRYNTLRSITPPPGGELMIDVQQRAVATLIDATRRHAHGTVALVSHADVLRALLLFALGMPIDALARLEVLPARISVLVVDDGGPRVLQVNGDSAP
jgi:broad specificity phosphatase PhoE